MLLVSTDLVQKTRTAASADDLLPLIQGAIALEFATIPPYLTAMLSLAPGKNREVWGILHSVVVDEMLHMAVMANLMTALGGGVVIDSPDFVPSYPVHLPMAINSGLLVPLQAYSVATVRDIFMQIETPETSLIFPADVEQPPYSTIGAFYHALADKLGDFGAGIFVGNPAHQLDAPSWFGDRLRPMTTTGEAVAAITMLVGEGEGTTTSPLDAQGDVAHYYRFAQLLHGRLLVADEEAQQGFAYRGAAIPFDATEVYPLTPNQTLDMLDPGSQVDRLARQFAFTFTKLLKALHRTFNGEPAEFDAAMGLMFELRLAGQKLCSQPVGGGLHAGPVFAYLTHSG